MRKPRSSAIAQMDLPELDVRVMWTSALVCRVKMADGVSTGMVGTNASVHQATSGSTVRSIMMNVCRILACILMLHVWICRMDLSVCVHQGLKGRRVAWGGMNASPSLVQEMQLV